MGQNWLRECTHDGTGRSYQRYRAGGFRTGAALSSAGQSVVIECTIIFKGDNSEDICYWYSSGRVIRTAFDICVFRFRQRACCDLCSFDDLNSWRKHWPWPLPCWWLTVALVDV
jgi:hypothetical protein